MATWGFFAVLVALFLWRLKPAKGVQTITTEQLKTMLTDQDKFFLDVRTKAEFKGRNIPQFKNIPLGSSFEQLPKDKEIVVVCQSGMRSLQACRQLKKQGFEKVVNVRGGMSAY